MRASPITTKNSNSPPAFFQQKQKKAMTAAFPDSRKTAKDKTGLNHPLQEYIFRQGVILLKLIRWLTALGLPLFFALPGFAGLFWRLAPAAHIAIFGALYLFFSAVFFALCLKDGFSSSAAGLALLELSLASLLGYFLFFCARYSAAVITSLSMLVLGLPLFSRGYIRSRLSCIFLALALTSLGGALVLFYLAALLN